jgi:hypothetical protein
MHRARRNAAQYFYGRNRAGHGAVRSGAVIKSRPGMAILGRGAFDYTRDLRKCNAGEIFDPLPWMLPKWTSRMIDLV